MHLTVNINTDVTKKLEQIHRSALPIAIRTTLNKVAFDMKKNTLMQTSGSIFEKRNPNFFKANSRVDMAKGFNVNNMASQVAMVNTGLKGSNNYAVQDLEQQEHGGSIKKKSFIPLAPARASSSNSRAVRPMNRLSSIQKLVDARKARGVNERQKFIKSAIFAGKGGFVLSEFKGKKIVWRVNSLDRMGESKSFKLTPLYTFEEGRTVKVKQTGFMKKAANLSAEHIQDYFFQEAEKQIMKYAA
jgi:hypothetical protein